MLPVSQARSPGLMRATSFEYRTSRLVADEPPSSLPAHCDTTYTSMLSIYRQVSRGLDGLAGTRRSPDELYRCTSSLLCCIHCKLLGRPYLIVVQACFGKHRKLRRPTTLCDQNDMSLRLRASRYRLSFGKHRPCRIQKIIADAPDARTTLIAEEAGRRCRLVGGRCPRLHRRCSAVELYKAHGLRVVTQHRHHVSARAVGKRHGPTAVGGESDARTPG